MAGLALLLHGCIFNIARFSYDADLRSGVWGGRIFFTGGGYCLGEEKGRAKLL